jgi:hypothetical protein
VNWVNLQFGVDNNALVDTGAKRTGNVYKIFTKDGFQLPLPCHKIATI